MADLHSRYLVLRRRELTRALALLKRAEERDKLAAENDRLKAQLARLSAPKIDKRRLAQQTQLVRLMALMEPLPRTITVEQALKQNAH